MHKLLLHPARLGRLYQQNHVGVYRSDDHGESWRRIDKGLPSEFGFALALNPHDPGVCYVTPLESDQGSFRATPGKLRVYRFNGGWRELGRGLPSGNVHVSVLREGMSSDPFHPCGLYLGTGSGQVFASTDAGGRWKKLASYLPPILSVTAAVV